MRCPYCEHPDSQVVNTREKNFGREIRRRRRCKNAECSRRFTTYERLENVDLKVIKKRDHRRVPFNSAKLLSSIEVACRKRPIPQENVSAVCADIERTLREEHEFEVPTSVIGKLVLARLRDLDAVAYIRYASVHREFSKAEDFAEAIGEVPSGES